MLAGTPAILVAAKTAGPWLLGGAYGVAAVVAVFARDLAGAVPPDGAAWG